MTSWILIASVTVGKDEGWKSTGERYSSTIAGHRKWFVKGKMLDFHGTFLKKNLYVCKSCCPSFRIWRFFWVNGMRPSCERRNCSTGTGLSVCGSPTRGGWRSRCQSGALWRPRGARVYTVTTSIIATPRWCIFLLYQTWHKCFFCAFLIVKREIKLTQDMFHYLQGFVFLETYDLREYNPFLRNIKKVIFFWLKYLTWYIKNAYKWVFYMCLWLTIYVLLYPKHNTANSKDQLYLKLHERLTEKKAAHFCEAGITDLYSKCRGFCCYCYDQ